MGRHFHASTPADYSLDTITTLMEFLNNPQDGLKVVHIAGTSGKTSTAYYAAALLTAADQKTGLTVSPHVDSLSERLQINGAPLTEAKFCLALTDFLREIEPAKLEPSRFEVMAAFAYWYFAKEKVDYAVIEVGLGGLKDGTNVVSRRDKVCVITDIGLDHTEMLGATLAEIAGQKIGIVRPGNMVFTFPQPEEVMAVYREHCARLHADLKIVKPPATEDYRRRNWQLAYETFKFLTERDRLPALPDKQLEKTRSTYVPGRLDARRIGDKTLIMDGAHNPQKMKAFVQSFRQIYPGQSAAVLLGLKQGKDSAAIIAELANISSRIILTSFEAGQDMPAKSADPGALAEAIRRHGIPATIEPGHSKAIKDLLAGPEEICLITGSFYLLGQIRSNKLLA